MPRILDEPALIEEILREACIHCDWTASFIRAYAAVGLDSKRARQDLLTQVLEYINDNAVVESLHATFRRLLP